MRARQQAPERQWEPAAVAQARGMRRWHGTTRRGACRARVARGGRIVFDRKDPITREPFADGDWENDSFSVELDGDENEHTPMASVRA